MSNRRLAVLATLTTVALVSCGAPSAPDLVKRAAKFSPYVVEAGSVASEKGQSEAVKQFARNVVETVGEVGDELKGIVQAEKLDVELPGRLDKRQQKRMDALKATTPETFNKTYAQLQVKALARAADLFDRYAEQGSNQALKQFAANALSTIEQHLEQAKKLPQ